MRGLLILNTGSPASTDKRDVELFIGEMLSDPFLINVPDFFRNILAKKIIAPLRASKSEDKYRLIWDKEHNLSPLIYHTQQLAYKLSNTLEMPVEIAMRYGSPSIPQALDNLEKKYPNLHEVVVIPMFPQYAESSYQTAVDAIGKYFYSQSFSYRLKILEPFYNDPEYIHALCLSLQPYINEPYDKLVFSFHSLPLSHEEKSREKGKSFDYVYQIKETIRLVTNELDIDPNKNRLVYSSAMGDSWLKPSLDESMKMISGKGVNTIITICPGFPADNLETLYDVNINARNIFLKNGGTNFSFVPGLNSENYWIDGIVKMITRKI